MEFFKLSTATVRYLAPPAERISSAVPTAFPDCVWSFDPDYYNDPSAIFSRVRRIIVRKCDRKRSTTRHGKRRVGRAPEAHGEFEPEYLGRGRKVRLGCSHRQVEGRL